MARPSIGRWQCARPPMAICSNAICPRERGESSRTSIARGGGRRDVERFPPGRRAARRSSSKRSTMLSHLYRHGGPDGRPSRGFRRPSRDACHAARPGEPADQVGLRRSGLQRHRRRANRSRRSPGEGHDHVGAEARSADAGDTPAINCGSPTRRARRTHSRSATRSKSRGTCRRRSSFCAEAGRDRAAVERSFGCEFGPRSRLRASGSLALVGRGESTPMFGARCWTKPRSGRQAFAGQLRGKR